MSPVYSHIKQWLQESSPIPVDTLDEMPGDASFRRYFRLRSGTQSYIVMDTSQQSDYFEPFVAIAKALLSQGLRVPQILAQNSEQGLMLLSDFGDTQYLTALHEKNADALYKTALDALLLLQGCHTVPDWPLPSFDQTFMLRELSEFKSWFLERHLGLTLTKQEEACLQATFNQLCQAAQQQPQVFIHRDYHSANLMLLPNQQVGILDFQDACLGPLSYDLVSLLRDCYIDWPDEKVQGWVAYYHVRLRADSRWQQLSLEELLRWFDWMGLQRHLKALFIFARKYGRDQTARYLNFMPRTLNYVVKISARYPELSSFHHFAQTLRLPPYIEEKRSCEA